MMVTELRPDIAAFFTLLDDLREEMPKEHSLAKLQVKGWERFCELGLPERRNDLFRYVKLHKLYSLAFDISSPKPISKETILSHLHPDCLDSHIVFINGHFSPDLSSLKTLPSKIVLLPLKEAMRTYGTLLTHQADKTMHEEKDPFAALNLALHREAAFLYLPPKTICKQPLQVLHILDEENKTLALPRLQIFVGASSEIKIFSTHAALSKTNFWINQATDISIEENAHVQYIQNNCHDHPNAWHFDALRANLKRSSSLKCVNASNGSETMRNDYRVALLGENGDVHLNGVWLLKNHREVHQHVLIDHQAPNCVSRQLFKGALKDQSHSSFEGKILVRKEAQETNAFQLNNNLLLSNGASAESKPNLEIFADNVKASHGATVGQLEKEELFYFQSRGFSPSDAKEILIRGFTQEVVSLIGNVHLEKQIGKHLEG